jgi:hypothetical protein
VPCILVLEHPQATFFSYGETSFRTRIKQHVLLLTGMYVTSLTFLGCGKTQN